ncbi:MAG: PHP domain-containing protein [Pyrodictiaceae archaeon]
MATVRGDLHIHSTYSDGKNSPQEIIVTALEKELTVISITDHDTFMGSLKALEYLSSYSLYGTELIVLIGAEIRTKEGDILVYCIDEPLEKIPRSALDLLDAAHENNCIAVPAHPYDLRRKGIGDLVYEARWDAIEVYNAFSDPLANKKAREAAKVLNIPGLAGSDAHVASAVGLAYNTIEIKEFTAEGIIKAIRGGNVHPVSGRLSLRSLIETSLWSIRRRI